jgi:transcriptional regulator with XRE-family HTH domain
MKIDSAIVKNLRLKNSWSQEKLADVAGVSMRTIQRMETDGLASLHSGNAVARAFGLNPAELLILADNVPSTDARSNSGSTYSFSIKQIGFLKPVLRYFILACLWIGMTFTLFLILATLVSGLFFWESTDLTFWESIGQGIIGASFFVPFLVLLYVIYGRFAR